MKIKGIKDKKGNIGYYDIETDKHIGGKRTMKQDNRLVEAVILAFLVAVALLWSGRAWSTEIVDTERLVTAIGRAENSWGYKPYGVMRNYCKPYDPDGQCRKGAIQTVEKWKRKLDYKSADEFIRKFAEIYAPTKGDLRPMEKKNNPNWYRNVLYFYSRNSH